MTALIHEVRDEASGELLVRHYVPPQAGMTWSWDFRWHYRNPWYEVWYCLVPKRPLLRLRGAGLTRFAR